MENSFQTSFIPKKPISPNNSKAKKPRSFFTVITVILLVIMILSAGGLFVYKSYLTKQKDVLSSSLLKVRDSFEKDTLDELELFDKRINTSKDILNGHIILSPLFELIGKLTIPSIQYTRFEHVTKDEGFFVRLSGISRDYRSIALQADVFNSAEGRYLKDVIFSNLVKDKNNYVIFDVEFRVDPSLLSYEKNILLEQGQNDSIDLSDNFNNN